MGIWIFSLNITQDIPMDNLPPNIFLSPYNSRPPGILGNSYVLHLQEFLGISAISPRIRGTYGSIVLFKFLSLIMTFLVFNLTDSVHDCTK